MSPRHALPVKVKVCPRLDRLEQLDADGERGGCQDHVEDQIWLVSFMDYDLGFFDTERGRVEHGPNPFAPDKVLTMCPE